MVSAQVSSGSQANLALKSTSPLERRSAKPIDRMAQYPLDFFRWVGPRAGEIALSCCAAAGPILRRIAPAAWLSHARDVR